MTPRSTVELSPRRALVRRLLALTLSAIIVPAFAGPLPGTDPPWSPGAHGRASAWLFLVAGKCEKYEAARRTRNDRRGRVDTAGPGSRHDHGNEKWLYAWMNHRFGHEHDDNGYHRHAHFRKDFCDTVADMMSRRQARRAESESAAAARFLMLSGTPLEAVTAGQLYLFSPIVESSGQTAPEFAIEGLPHWAGFDAVSGELYGTPDEADIGLYEGITISATDGVVETSLPRFSIEVVAPGAALGAVTLSWAPPTENEDGSHLNDLAGYWVYWGNNPGTYTEWMRIDNPGLTTIVIEDLVPGTWEFAMTSFNADGVESRLSNAVTRFVE